MLYLKLTTMRHCLAIDLKNDPALIAQYEQYHQRVWPEVLQSLTNCGITDMEIYRVENRLFMVIETTADFSFERKNQMDTQNPKVQQWETLMLNYQQAMPTAKTHERWLLAELVFKFEG